MKDRYFHYENSGDPFVGRTVTGISSGSDYFSISPVFWNVESDDEVNL